ncbi:hypothetical protein R1flu_004526 [Riccia fluitans]|uniref:Uncharacterized protein n=1 Tax=Riccia fluitans TaxID=41844 RepID=A0ABD1YQK0_9MARC
MFHRFPLCADGNWQRRIRETYQKYFEEREEVNAEIRLKRSRRLEETEKYQIVDFVVTNSDVENDRWEFAGIEITDSLIAFALRLDYFPPREKAFSVLQARLSQIPVTYTMFFDTGAVSEPETNLPFSACKSPSIRFVAEFIRNAIWLDSEACELNFAMVANLVGSLRGDKVDWVRLLSFWLQKSIKRVQEAYKTGDTVKVYWSVLAKLIIARSFGLFVHLPQAM